MRVVRYEGLRRNLTGAEWALLRFTFFYHAWGRDDILIMCYIIMRYIRSRSAFRTAMNALS